MFPHDQAMITHSWLQKQASLIPLSTNCVFQSILFYMWLNLGSVWLGCLISQTVSRLLLKHNFVRFYVFETYAPCFDVYANTRGGRQNVLCSISTMSLLLLCFGLEVVEIPCIYGGLRLFFSSMELSRNSQSFYSYFLHCSLHVSYASHHSLHCLIILNICNLQLQ